MRGFAMTLYRLGCTMLVLSTFCLAVSVGENSQYFMVISVACLMLSAQIYASGRAEEHPEKSSARKR
jgi:hypothetical protein